MARLLGVARRDETTPCEFAETAALRQASERLAAIGRRAWSRPMRSSPAPRASPDFDLPCADRREVARGRLHRAGQLTRRWRLARLAVGRRADLLSAARGAHDAGESRPPSEVGSAPRADQHALA